MSDFPVHTLALDYPYGGIHRLSLQATRHARLVMTTHTEDKVLSVWLTKEDAAKFLALLQSATDEVPDQPDFTP